MPLRKIRQFFAPKPTRKKSRILVIDDNPTDQKIISSALSRGGYGVLNAVDGKTGLAKTRELLPDLVILDYNLPDAKGSEICQAIKADKITCGIPVLFLTWIDSPGSIIDMYEQGASNYLAKPINPRFLIDQVEMALKDKDLEK